MRGPLPAARQPFLFTRTLYPLYVCGHIPLAREPFSFTRIPSGLFWSLLLRVRTIISASGYFSIACVAPVYSILSNERARRARTFFVRADLLSIMCGLCPSHADHFLSSARERFLLIFHVRALRVRTFCFSRGALRARAEVREPFFLKEAAAPSPSTTDGVHCDQTVSLCGILA